MYLIKIKLVAKQLQEQSKIQKIAKMKFLQIFLKEFL
jgi:hypothetical protein